MPLFSFCGRVKEQPCPLVNHGNLCYTKHEAVQKIFGAFSLHSCFEGESLTIFNKLCSAISYLRLFVRFRLFLFFGTNYFGRLLFFCTVFGSVSSLSFRCLAARMTKASCLDHAAAYRETVIGTTDVRLIYSRAITFRSHTAHTILQLLPFQFTVLGIL